MSFAPAPALPAMSPSPADDPAPPKPRRIMPPWRRLVRTAVRTLIVCILAIVVLLLTMETSLIYPRGGSTLPPTQHADGTVDADGYFRVTTADGLSLAARWWDVAGPDAPVVLWFHGNAETIVDREPMAWELVQNTNCRVLQAEYRGYGGNPGDPSDDGFAEDARADLAWLRDVQGVAPERLIVFGRSLGGAAAVRLVAEMDVQPAGLWIESTFTSIPDKVRDTVPFLPGLHLLIRNKHDSLRRMPSITCPVLSLHAEADSIVPFWMQAKLIDALPAETSRSVHSFPGLDHNDLPWRANLAYWQAVRTWLSEVFPAHELPSIRTQTATGE